MKKKNSLSPDAVKIIKDSFEANEVFLNTDSSIIFLCGKKISPEILSARELLLKYSQKHFSNYLFFLAEDFFDAYPLPSTKDLLSIEHYLSKYSDCIIIILESESAFAELGAFSIDDEIAKNLIVINDKKFKESDSFINLGPIKKVNRVSKFGEVINTNLETITLSGHDLGQKLTKIQRKKRKRIKLSNPREFKSFDGKEKMLLLLDLVNLFEPISYSELIELLINFFGKGTYDIQFEIGLLSALKLIAKFDNYYVRNIRELKYYYDFEKKDSRLIKSLNINHIHKYNKVKYQHLLEKVK
ncbi:MAG: hypothetical protein CMF23_14115 [Ignavibacteriae bacterium]|nr:hypothetical protein [Ignavibacteriota bacterium]